MGRPGSGPDSTSWRTEAVLYPWVRGGAPREHRIGYEKAFHPRSVRWGRTDEAPSASFLAAACSPFRTELDSSFDSAKKMAAAQVTLLFQVSVPLRCWSPSPGMCRGLTRCPSYPLYHMCQAAGIGLLLAFVYSQVIKFYWEMWRLRHFKGPMAIPVVGNLYDKEAFSVSEPRVYPAHPPGQLVSRRPHSLHAYACRRRTVHPLAQQPAQEARQGLQGLHWQPPIRRPHGQSGK